MTALPDPRERPLLKVAEVAEILREGEKVVRSAIDAGQLPSVRVGRYVRVPTAPLYALCGLTPDSEAPLPRLRVLVPGSGGPDAAA
jgi:excisionase family DNA binding protein